MDPRREPDRHQHRYGLGHLYPDRRRRRQENQAQGEFHRQRDGFAEERTGDTVPGSTNTIQAAATCNVPTYPSGKIQLWTGRVTIKEVPDNSTEQPFSDSMACLEGLEAAWTIRHSVSVGTITKSYANLDFH